MHGTFRDRLIGPSGASIETPWRSNLVVWSALDLIGALLCNRSSGLTYLAVGTGDPAWGANPPSADRGRTRLTTEVFRTRLEPGDTLTYDPQAGRVHVRVTIGRGRATGTLREFGLFGGDASARPDSGVLVNHATHPAVQKAEGDVLERELFLTLEPALAPGARDLIGGLLARRSGLAGITHVALGTSGDAPAEAPRDLLAEAYRKPLASGNLSYDGQAHTVEARASFEIGEGPAQVLETGLFGGMATERPDTGFLVARQTGAAVDRSQPKRLEPRFRLILVARTDVKVPALVGQTLDAARTAIAADLRVGRVTNRETEADPAGNVLEQSPTAGTIVNEGAAVDLVVAVLPTVAVPEIVGEPEGQATTLLKRLGLVVRDDARVEQESEEPASTVLASSPSPGTRVSKGTAIALTIAVPRRVDVPDIRGRTPAAAAVLLHAAGIGVAAELAVEESGASPGTVVSQDPAPGAHVPVGTEVKLTLATPWKVEVPDLKGKALEEATGILEQAAGPLIEKLTLPPGIAGLGLGAVRERADNATPGTILEQEPAAQARAALYSTVDVVIASVATLAVPNLVGAPEANAITMLTAAGFAVGTTSHRAADAVPGSVVDQDPPPGVSWPRGGRVGLTLATGRTVTVPEVVGLSLDAAREAIIGGGLTLGPITTEIQAGGVPGSVASQDPAARQTVPLGAAVNLVVLAGVPNVVGMTRADAEAAIAAAGIPIGQVSEKEMEGRPGVVLSQAPAGGTAVDATTQMTLEVSIAPRVEVPAITGRPLNNAKKVLARAGLELDVAAKAESDQAEGTILEQEPAAGQRVDRGTAVRVTIAVARPRTVAVPQLVGLASAQATEALTQAGLTARVGEVRPTPGAAAGTVAQQSPAAGTTVPVGSEVVLILASADAATEVPELRRLSVDAATAAANAASLQLTVTGSTPAVEELGTVVSQDPIPGSRVPAGSVVSVLISAGGRVLVPGVVGRDQVTAGRLVQRSGLQPDFETRFSLTRPPGTVIGQDPAASTQVEPGSTVTLFVAGRELEPFRPPRPIEVEPFRPSGPIEVEPVRPPRPIDLEPIRHFGPVDVLVPPRSQEGPTE